MNTVHPALTKCYISVKLEKNKKKTKLTSKRNRDDKNILKNMLKDLRERMKSNLVFIWRIRKRK